MTGPVGIPHASESQRAASVADSGKPLCEREPTRGEGPARSRFYDGSFYAFTLDRLLSGLHAFLAKQVPDGARVLDAGCGTGDVAFRLAPRVAAVLGVERSPRHVAYAERRRVREGLANVSFRLGDAASLPDLGTGSFDVATIALALHEMPAGARAPVLRELARVARRVLAVDFAAPMPWNLVGLRNRALEVAAGREHYAGFRSYTARGGLPALVAEAGLILESTRAIDGGAMVLAIARAADSR